MKKKSSQVYVLDNIPYSVGAPVAITSGCLVKDGVSGRPRCQLELAGLSEDPVRAVTVLVTPTDAEGVALEPAQRQRFSGLSTRKDGRIGGKTELVLNKRDAGAFTASVEEVVFADGRSWRADEKTERVMTPRMLTLEEAYEDDGMAEQFRIRLGEDCRYLPWDGDALWYCTCGTVNGEGDSRCRRCRRVRKALMRIKADELRKETDRRRKREQPAEQEETPAGRTERKQFSISPWAVIPAAVIVMAAMAFLLFGSGKIFQRWEDATVAPTEKVEAAPEAATTPEPEATTSEAPMDPAEAERNRAYEQAVQLLERADAGDASALSQIGKTQEDVKEGETAAMLLYRAALEAFEGLGDHADSTACAVRCREGIAAQEQIALQQAYDTAAALLEERHYSEACRRFRELGDYGNSGEMAIEAVYRKAAALCDVIRSNDVRGVYAQLSTDPDAASRFVLAGEQAPSADSACAQSLLAACGNDPTELVRADVPEEGMPSLADAVIGLFGSLNGYRDSDASMQSMREATDHTKDFYRLCAEGDLAGAQEWLNTWGGELEDREFWQGRLEQFIPYCDSWTVYSGDMSILPYMGGREGTCTEFRTHVSLEGEDSILHLTARDGEEEYSLDFYHEPDKDYFYNSDSPPYSFLMVINSTGRMSTLMYNTNTGGLMTSCEYKRVYNG